MNILIASKETSKDFLERVNGVDFIRNLSIKELQDINWMHDLHNVNLEKLVYTIESNSIKVNIRNPVKTKNYEAYSLDDFMWSDVVISFGGDGEAIDVARSINKKNLGDNLPLLWIEKAEDSSYAALASSQRIDYVRKVLSLQDKNFKVEKWSRALGTIYNNGKEEISDLALNEIFFGDLYSSGMARYKLQLGDKAEPQRSSGGIVSTQVGLQAWYLNVKTDKLRTILMDRMRLGFYRHIKEPNFERKKLEYRIQNPGGKYDLKMINGIIKPDQKMIIKSLMRYDGAVIFDGSKPHYNKSRCYEFKYGSVLEIKTSDEPVKVLRFNRKI